jgi:small-conductance mechanosensitive channel
VVLAQFPYTRVWGEQLNGFLFGLLGRFVLAAARAVPDLLAAALIFWLAHLMADMLRRFFAKVASGSVQLSWLGADVALTTSRLCVAAVWLFALAMAYPYLPGSETEAFRGLSVLVGLMISLGASNLVGQLASGLILTYTRTFHAGEYVRVGQDEGTVVRLGAFTTRIRTGMGEELTISNSQVLGAVTRNYSRTVKGHGFIVDTTVVFRRVLMAAADELADLWRTYGPVALTRALDRRRGLPETPWFCAGCASRNGLAARRCYRCGGRREECEAPVPDADTPAGAGAGLSQRNRRTG